MLQNYWNVAIRALAKNKVYAFINILGLALGLAACLLILIYVRYETSYDEAIPNADRTYQLQQSSVDTESGDVFRFQGSAFAAVEPLRKDFPQVESTAYLMPGRPLILQNGQSTLGEDVRYTDGNFLEVVELPLVQGDRRTALSKPGSLVITQSEAIKRFGTEQVVGKTLTLVRAGTPTDYRITGVLRDLPRNSHVSASMIARVDLRSFFGEDYEPLSRAWGYIGGFVYVRLKEGADAAAIREQLPAWEKRNIPNSTSGNQVSNIGTTDDWQLTKITDIHLGQAQDDAMTPGNSRSTVTTFSVVAALILLLASINFVNLSTARASQRSREVALRKVLGASRGQLIVQFLCESLIITAVAMLVGVAIAEVALPHLSAFLEADLALNYVGENGMLWQIVLLTLAVAILGGLYPAFYLSRYQPASVLKANRSADTPGSGRLRTALVVAQFAISIGLIICTAVIYSQMEFARSIDPGYQREGLLQLTGLDRSGVDEQAESIAQQIAKIPNVKSVARSTVGVDQGGTSDFFVYRPGQSNPYRLFTNRVGKDYFHTMGIKLLAGRDFSDAQGRDQGLISDEATPEERRAFVARGINVIVNEAGAKRLGFGNAGEAVGQTINMPELAGEEFGQVPATIIGVVANTRFRSVRDPVQPSVYRYSRVAFPLLEVRFDGNPKSVRDAVEQVWKQRVPEVPFEAEFADEIVADLYRAEAARGRIFAFFSLFAVIIGCMGLFGLAAFTAERRTKEIGIRKVLGARSRDIVRLLVWQFTRPVLLANVIAWPLAWWAMRDWLNGFDARIALGPTPFVLAALLALVIAVATIAGHAMKVARAKPVHALRYE